MSKEKRIVYSPETCDIDQYMTTGGPYSQTEAEAREEADKIGLGSKGEDVFIYKIIVEKVAVGKRIWEKE
jgi:hypothetical protein